MLIRVSVQTKSNHMLLSRIFSLTLLTLFLSGCGKLLQPSIDSSFASIRPGAYQLDMNHTAILFKIDHLGFSKFVGRFENAEAALDYDADQPELSKLDARVDMSSVNVNNEKFERTLRNRFWFNTDKFPQARFVTLSARKVGEKRLDFDGELTFLGVTQPLTLQVTINGAGNNIANGKYTLGFSATAVIKRSAHGLDRYTPAIGNNVELEVHAEFLRQ